MSLSRLHACTMIGEPMARPAKITNEIKLLIAKMHAERPQRDNKEIAEELHISPSSVSNVLRESFEDGRIRLVFSLDGLSSQELELLERMESKGRLDEELQQRLADMEKAADAVVKTPAVRILDSGSTGCTADDWTNRLEVFSRAAAPYIGGLVARSHVVATSWGETLSSICRALREHPPQRPNRPIQFFGFCGEMLEGPPRKASASSLAHQLDDIVNGDPAHLHSYWLAGVPSRFPKPNNTGALIMTRSECDAVKHYIRQLPGYRKAFGTGDAGDGLFDRADLCLTSCGPKERPLGYGGVQELREAGLSLREARSLLVGDISGFLLKDPTAKGPTDKVDAINARLVAPDLLGKLRKCARRALDGKAAGTVVCAIGANKCEAVTEIVRLGLASRLVLDTDLAQALLRK